MRATYGATRRACSAHPAKSCSAHVPHHRRSCRQCVLRVGSCLWSRRWRVSWRTRRTARDLPLRPRCARSARGTTRAAAPPQSPPARCEGLPPHAQRRR
eukprot:scaffold115812_cov29-Tisochrysis_lutea.AAC.4